MGVYQRLGSKVDCSLGDEACFAASDKKRYCKRFEASADSVVKKPLDLKVDQKLRCLVFRGQVYNDMQYTPGNTPEGF